MNKMYSRIKVSKNFSLDEFVDPHTYFNETDNGLSLVSNKLFAIAQRLRDKYRSGIRINNWWWYYEKHKLEMPIAIIIRNIEMSKTISKWSGLRTYRCKIGASRSAHKTVHTGQGLAIDPKGDSTVFFNIIKNDAGAFYFIGVRRLEDISITPTWLHIDLLERNTEPDSIRVVDRTKMTETIRW